MNFHIFAVFLFSSFLALYLHQTNALLYKLQTAHPPPHPHPHQAASSQHLSSAEEMLVPTSNEKARQELIYLFITPPTTKLGHISIPALQILCYLRMAKIPFYALNNRFLLASARGKPQFAQIKGQIFDDPNKIIDVIETIEAIKNKQPQRIVEKTENEIKMEEALDTMQNIIYADLLTSSENKKYDGLFHEDGNSQLELLMEDDSLKEQMFLTLTKIDAMKEKETDKTAENHPYIINDASEGSNSAWNEVEFIKAYLDIKNRGTELEKDIFLTHENSVKLLQEFPEDEEEFEISEVKKGKQKKIINLPARSSNQINPQQKLHGDWDRFKVLMAKRIEKRLSKELAKLKSSINAFSYKLGEQIVKIPILTDEEMKRIEQEEVQRRKQEEMEKQNVNRLNSLAENTGIPLFKQTQSLKKGWGTFSGKLSSSFKNLQFELGISSAASQIPKFQLEPRKMAECSEDELLEAFKHAVDVLAPLVKPKPFSFVDAFLFHRKTTATEARLLATLSHLFTKPQTIPKLKEFMAIYVKEVPVYRQPTSVGEARLMRHLPQEYEKKEFFRNANLQILWEYFEMRKDQFGLNFKTFDTLKPLSFERMEEWKYMGLYPFETNSMEWLPHWIEQHWSEEPNSIGKVPLHVGMVGPDHEILTTIFAKIAFNFWEKLREKKDCQGGKGLNYTACKKGLLHIVAAYLCKGSINLKKGKWPMNSTKECTEWHLEECEKLNSSRLKLFQPLLIPLKSIIDQTIEEFVGIEQNILEAIKQEKNTQEELGKKGKGKAKLNTFKLGYYAHKSYDKIEKWRLPNPPRYVRCKSVIIKYTAAPLMDYLHENGHIFQYPPVLLADNYVGHSQRYAFDSYVEIHVDLKTDNEVWPKLFTTLAAVERLEFYRNDCRPIQLQAIGSKKTGLNRMMADLLHVEAIDRRLEKKLLVELENLWDSRKIDYSTYMEQRKFWRKKVQKKINEIFESESHFGPSIELMLKWLYCGQEGSKKILDFKCKFTELIPKKICHLLLENLKAFQAAGDKNNGENYEHNCDGSKTELELQQMTNPIPIKPTTTTIINVDSLHSIELIIEWKSNLKTEIIYSDDHNECSSRILNPLTNELCHINMQEYYSTGGGFISMWRFQ